MATTQANATTIVRALLVTAGFCFIGPADAETIRVDDFDDCNDSGWTHVGHIVGPAFGPADGGTWDPTFTQLGSCAYRLAAIEAVGSAMTATWDESEDALFSDGYFRARVRPETQETAVLMGMRADKRPFGDAYLGEIFLHNGTMRIRDHAAGPSSIVQTDLEINANEDWFIQIGTTGDEFSLKAWPVGDPEPTTPQLRATYSSHSTGLFVIGTGVPPGVSGVGSTVFDDIVFIPEPSTFVLEAFGVLGIVAIRRRR